MSKSSPKLLIAGGGTGGHILAGIAIADAWRAKWGKSTEVRFIGGRGGLEETLVPRAGYSLDVIKIGSLNRVSLTRRLKTFVELPFAFFKSAYLLFKLRPSWVIGVGGYSSGPVVLVAKILSFLGVIPTRIGILEQNSVPGMTNRILGKFAEILFAAFPGIETQFPDKKVLVTGNPIRSSFHPMHSAERNPFVIFLFGGSKGALGVNTLMIEALPYLEDLKDRLRIIHQTGIADYDRVCEGYRKNGISARIEKFIYDMPTVYQEASLLICRAGASTLAEVAAVGRAAVLVPLPTAADNHQEKNARVYAEKGAALILRQQDSKGEDLAKVIRELLENPARIAEMEQKVTQFFKPRAAEDLVEGLTQNV